MKQKIRDYCIESSDDDKNYIVSKATVSLKGKNAGEKVERIIGYHNSISSAVKEVARLCANKADGLKSWLAEYKAVINSVEDILS